MSISPIFVATFADGETTRMSVFTTPDDLDVERGKKDERARWSAVGSLAPKKRLFLNVRWERLLGSLSGKKFCDINERLDPF